MISAIPIASHQIKMKLNNIDPHSENVLCSADEISLYSVYS